MSNSVGETVSEVSRPGIGAHGTSLLVVGLVLLSLLVAACSSENDVPDGPGPDTPIPATATLPATDVPATQVPAGTSTETPVATAAGPPTEQPPSPATSVPAAAATADVPTATPTPATPLTRSEQLEAIGNVVADIRELPAVDDANVSLVDKARIAEELADDLADPEVLQEIAELEVWLKLLGLIPQDSDLLEIETALLEGAVVGLYNSETGELMVLGGEGDVSVKEEAVYSHEYAHLLQDVTFDLSKLFEDAESDTERANALQALVEGEATFVETLYSLQNFVAADLPELLEVDPADLAVLEATPDFLILALSWPYTAGYAFTESIWKGGGMTNVNRVWSDLPETTEQVIHPEKYYADEYPETALVLPELGPVLGEGWSVHSSDVLGEALISIWLEALGAETAVAAQAAAGWGRDAYTVLVGPAGAAAMGIVIEWDDPGTDALQFSAALEATLDAETSFTRLESSDVTVTRWDGPGGVLSFALDGATGAAGVAVAPTQEQADALLSALVEN